MHKILGIDLGVASIGWALIRETSENESDNQIIDAGVRLVPLNTDEVKEFGKGGNVPTNVARRTARGMRRNLQRYRLRRSLLIKSLERLGLLPDEGLLGTLPPSELFNLRAKALREPVTRAELGRILLHLNLRRGYKSSRKEQDVDKDGKKQSDYLKEISSREQELIEKQQTIGERFAAGLRNNPSYRVRQQVFNRDTYQEEFDRIWDGQSAYHPEIMTDENRRLLRDKIIYRQRPLRSQKGLVGECVLESNHAVNKEGHTLLLPNGLPRIVRPKCAPKSSPLAQECKIWESLHNLRILDERGAPYLLTQTQKQQVFNVLQDRTKNLRVTELFKLLGLTSSKKFTVDALIKEKGLECNSTRARLLEAFNSLNISRRDLLTFDPAIEEAERVNLQTGEKIRILQICTDFDRQPLYQLWHLLYATEDENDLVQLLQKRYQFTSEQAAELAKIDFTSAGFSNKSSRAMRRLLPHYREGADYTDACKLAGYNHSNSLTKAENESRTLLDKLDVLPKNSLRNPVVEKVLNQMIHLVNAVIARYGRPAEIRVELARELKQAASERQKADKRNRDREKENKRVRALVAEHLHIQPESVTKTQIEKWKLWEEIGGISLYTGKPIERRPLLLGEGIDTEHIIPRVRQFDDSFENKTICETWFNEKKSNYTARDFMEGGYVEGLQDFETYLRRIKDLLDSGSISKAKYNRLMMSANEIPEDFLARQLRETQYIARKAVELLRDVCHQVHSTSGGVTDFLRHQWGWDETIQDLRLPQFREAGLTEFKKIKKGQQNKEIIPGWTKRLDHRHHALDALVVACTRQAHIKRINDLNQSLEGKFGHERRDALLATGRDKYLAGPAPFTHAQVCTALEAVLVSYKQSAKVATRSKNKPKGAREEQVTLTPRGALHKETIYGRIRRYSEKKVLLNARFDVKLIAEIAHPHQRELVEARLAEYGGDARKAFKDLDKNPILYGKNGQKRLTRVTVWERWYVAREPISENTSKNKVEYITDGSVKRVVKARLDAARGDSKQAFKNLGNDPVIVSGRPVRSVRTLNPAEQMIQLPRGYAKSEGNHHIAIYRDTEGKKHEHVVSFWDAFQRRRLGLPAVITDVATTLDFIEQYPGDLSDLNLPENREWQFVTSLAINEMFVFGLDPKEVDFLDTKNRQLISKNLFRVRKLSAGNYWFLHHLESQILEDNTSKALGRAKFASVASMEGAIKIKVDRLGIIYKTGE